MRLQAALLVAVAARGGAGTPNCTVYIADPGTEFNSASTSEFPGSATPEKHVAHWMHTGLLSSALRTSRIQEARVIFVAHYFLKHQEKGWTLHDWKRQLKGGPARLFNGNTELLRRWRDRPFDFAIAPMLPSCAEVRAPVWLDMARWVVINPWCIYRHGYDIVAPPIVSPSPASDASPRANARRHFITYVGKLRKPYLQPPMTKLRFLMWSHLRAHPNVTFLAEDVQKAAAPYLPSDGSAQPRCAVCKFSCKQCIALPPATAHLPLSVGSMEEVQSRAHYQTYLKNSTFCLVLRGDHENSRRFSEAILAGCVPVLIADMPAWPFARRLDYKKFSYEFSWAGASRDPLLVVNGARHCPLFPIASFSPLPFLVNSELLRLPAGEIAVKQRELARVRPLFQYRADADRPGAVQQLVQDLCASPTKTTELMSVVARGTHKRPSKPSRGLAGGADGHAKRLGYPGRTSLYELRVSARR